MFQVIAAAFGLVGGINNNASAQYALDKQQQLSGLEYAKYKQMQTYSQLSALNIGAMLLAGGLLLFIILAVKKKQS